MCIFRKAMCGHCQFAKTVVVMVVVLLVAAAAQGCCPVLTKTGNLTNAEIKSLDTTPVTMVAASGTGYAHVLISAYVEHLAGVTPFTPSGVALAITYGNTLTYHAQTAAVSGSPFDSSDSSVQWMIVSMYSSATSNGMLISDCENLPLSMFATSALADGTGSGRYFIAYQTIPVA